MEAKPRHVVELLPAYAWICDDCGKECFTRAITAELTEDEVAELRDEHGVQPWEAGCFTQVPDVVKCDGCGAQFRTERFGENCAEPDGG